MLSIHTRWKFVGEAMGGSKDCIDEEQNLLHDKARSGINFVARDFRLMVLREELQRKSDRSKD